MSLWDESLDFPEPSFREPVTYPVTDPTVGPFVRVEFNQEWAQLVSGCILQLCQPPSVASLDPAVVDPAMENATRLLNLFMAAGAGMPSEYGDVALTILAGTASITTAVVFTYVYTSIPVVVVASNSEGLHASWSDVTLLGFTLHLTCATPTPADIIGQASWGTNP
jgi:hypothetical protein